MTQLPAEVCARKGGQAAPPLPDRAVLRREEEGYCKDPESICSLRSVGEEGHDQKAQLDDSVPLARLGASPVTASLRSEQCGEEAQLNGSDSPGGPEALTGMPRLQGEFCDEKQARINSSASLSGLDASMVTPRLRGECRLAKGAHLISWSDSPGGSEASTATPHARSEYADEKEAHLASSDSLGSEAQAEATHERCEYGDEKESRLKDSVSVVGPRASEVTPPTEGDLGRHKHSGQLSPQLPNASSALHEAEVGNSTGREGSQNGPSIKRGQDSAGGPTANEQHACEEPAPGDEKEVEFEIAIERGEGQQLGVDVVHQDWTLVIGRVNAGLVAVWNRAHPDRCVRPGDLIVDVNGVRGTSERLTDTIRREVSLRVRIRRLLEFSVLVRKAGRLGIDVASHERSLRVLNIGAGPFHQWNARVGMDRQIRVGDHVVEANSRRGTAAELLTTIRGSEEFVEIVLRRSGSSCEQRSSGAAALTFPKAAPAPSTRQAAEATAPPTREAFKTRPAPYVRHASKATLAPSMWQAVEDEDIYLPPKGGHVVIDIRE